MKKMTKNKMLAVLLMLGTTSFTQAANIDAAKDFTAHGSIATFKFQSPTESAARTIVYYLPKSISNPWDVKNLNKLMVFLHGGGASTSTDASATSTAKMYLNDFINYAEKNKTIIIAPTTWFGWGQQEVSMFPKLIDHSAMQVGIDQNHMVLAGHSMGGMAITRDYPYLTHFFSGFLAMSAGTQDYMMTEDMLLAYLNGTPYIHQNGKDDHFEAFDIQQKKLMSKLSDVEARYNRKANLKYILRAGGHNYDLQMAYSQLDELFSYKRVHFPKYIQAYFYAGANAANPTNRSPSLKVTQDAMFWVKAADFITPVLGANQPYNYNGVFVEISVQDQTITMKTRTNTLKPKKYELTLSSELVNLGKEVTVILDGKTMFQGMAPATTGTPVITIMTEASI